MENRAFSEGVRNTMTAKPPIPKPYIPFSHFPTYPQTLKAMGIIHLKPWFVKYFIYKDMPQKAWDFFEKDLNLFIKPYKSL